MKTINCRFGEIDFDPANTLKTPRGFIGFEDLRDFIVMPKRNEGPLFWIQSADDPAIAFLLTDPTQFFPEYQVGPDKEESALLDIGPNDSCFVLSVVTVHPDQTITLNLAAPVLFAPETNNAVQVILEGATYQTRTPLPTTAPTAAAAAK